MTKVKLCGLSRPCDIEAVNELQPEYIGFVFWKKSKRCITPELALELKSMLDPKITTVGVFLDEELPVVIDYLKRGIIDVAQLHGSEDEDFIRQVKKETGKSVIRAFPIRCKEDIEAAEASIADYVLLDSGAGTGQKFNWQLIGNIKRPYFLAGGLGTDNAEEAIRSLHPMALDVSSGIETDGRKDREKMAAFVRAARKEG